MNQLTVTYSEGIKELADEFDLTDEIKLVDDKGATISFTEAEVVDGKLVLTVTEATKVSSLTTLEVNGSKSKYF